MKAPPIALWMALALALITGLAYWDEERESRAALEDFAAEQTTLAGSLGGALRQRLRTVTPDEIASETPAELLSVVREVERPGVLVLLRKPGDPDFVTSDGRSIAAPALKDAPLEDDRATFHLDHEESARLGLPPRTSMVGLRRIEAPRGGAPWTIAVVATAETVRDREERATWRLVLSALVAAGLVGAFGGYAMRRQRTELELQHSLALSKLELERDDRLVRADKLATMGALATGVAHEVSTPLGVILGRAEQLLPKQTDDRTRRAVETIVAQTERIFAVVRGFLALARGREPKLERHAPGELARAAVGLVEHRFAKASVALRHEVARDLPRVACDPRLFEQVLVNLLLNACDACSEGGAVELTVESTGPGAGAAAEAVAFVVTDDGVGISPDVAERAVEPFFTTKGEGEGTGLGLAIASEIVKHHRGTLSLTPRPEGGTRAAVELPAAKDDA
jgi:signal transduction histidine kinase